MANTVALLNYANTFGDWVVATNTLSQENNNLAISNYHKNSGTLYLDTSSLALQSNGTAIFAQQLAVQGTGSYLTVQNNANVSGQMYLTNNVLSLTTSGLVAINGQNTGISIANTANIGGNLYVTGNVAFSNTLSVTGITTLYNTLNANGIIADVITANTINTPSGNITNLQVQNQLTVSGNFTLTGATVYAANTFILSQGSSVGITSAYSVNRGYGSTSATIRWNEPSKYWDIVDVGSNLYFPILTSNSGISSSVGTSSLYTMLTSNSSNLNANVGSAYGRANTSSNSFVGTYGTATPNGGNITFNSNNGISIIGSDNTINISTAQDLRTTASPIFNSLSLTNALPLAYGGTGATSSAGALTNILPGGTSAGYVLTTGGPGSFYWAAGGGGGGGATPGTSINSSRMNYTATAGQTVFVAPTYTIGASQLRVYVDGVRQYNSDYTESANTVTLLSGCAVNDSVLIEVDGYIINPYYANNISYTVNSLISTSANTIQLAIDGLVNIAAPKLNPQLTGVPLSVTASISTSNTMIATTGFVYNALANTTALYSHNISGTSSNITQYPLNQSVSSGSAPTFSATNISGSASTLNIGGNAATATTAGTCTGTSIGFPSGGTAEIGRYLDFHGTSGNGNDFDVRFDCGASGASGNGQLYITAGQGLVCNGNITAFSDERLKENIKTIDNALSKVNKLRGVTFTRNDIFDKETSQTGVIAQEVIKILPEVVKIGEDGIHSVAYGNMVGLLIEAIKDLSKQNEDLSKRLGLLETI